MFTKVTIQNNYSHSHRLFSHQDINATLILYVSTGTVQEQVKVLQERQYMRPLLMYVILLSCLKRDCQQ